MANGNTLLKAYPIYLPSISLCYLLKLYVCAFIYFLSVLFPPLTYNETISSMLYPHISLTHVFPFSLKRKSACETYSNFAVYVLSLSWKIENQSDKNKSNQALT